MDQSLIVRLETYSQKYGISNNKAAAGVGYTASVLSQWKSGQYKGDIDAVEAKVRAWLDLQEAREESGVVPFVPLKRTQRIKTAIRIAHEEKFIALVLGNSGAGKSRALEEYATENPNTTILVKTDPTMKLETIIWKIAQILGIDTKGRIAEVSDRIVSDLRRRDYCIIFDEADYLTDTVLEWARIALYDKGRAALVFAGLPRIEYRIKALKADHRQLENRVGMMLKLDDPDSSDIKEVLAAVWPGLDEATQKVFEKAARQSLHLLVRHIALSKRAMRPSGDAVPTAELAAEAARYLV